MKHRSIAILAAIGAIGSSSAISQENNLTLFDSSLTGNEYVRGEQRGGAMSGDGRFVFPVTTATMLTNGDTLYVTDMELQSTDTVNHPVSDAPITGRPNVATSPSGRLLALQVSQAQATAMGNSDVLTYVYDNVDATLTPATVGVGGSTPMGCVEQTHIHNNIYIDASDLDNSIVYQTECTNLTTTDNNNETDIVKYNIDSNTVSVLSHTFADDTTTANGKSTSPKMSADGRYVVYSSTATDLTDTSCTALPDQYHLYLYDSESGTNTRLNNCASGMDYANQFAHSISGDGSTVFFQTGYSNSYQVPLSVFYSTVTQTSESAAVQIRSNGYNTDLSYNGQVLAYLSSTSFAPSGNIMPQNNVGNVKVNRYDRYANHHQTISVHKETGAPAQGFTHNELAISDAGDFLFFGGSPMRWMLGEHIASGENGVHVFTGNGYARNYRWVNVRNTSSSWTVFDGMRLIGDNTWETIIQFDNATDQFKFDMGGTWNDGVDFGDNTQDGIADLGGNNVLLPNGAGTYRIVFNDQTNRYTLSKLDNATIDTVSLHASYNAWATTPMQYRGNQVWEGVFTTAETNGSLHFVKASNSSVAFGDANSDSFADAGGADIQLNGAGKYLVKFYADTNLYLIHQLDSTVDTTPLAPKVIYTELDSIEVDLGAAKSFSIYESSFYASAYDIDGTIDSFTWSSTEFASDLQGNVVSHTFTTEGTFNISLTVVDNDGLSASTEFAVNVVDNSPIADAGNDRTVFVGETVLFDSANSTAKYGINQLWWESASFPANSFGWNRYYGDTAEHIFTTPGVYEVELYVSDYRYLNDTDTVVITVVEEPTCTANYPSMHARGNFNSWAAGAMTLNQDCVWELSASLSTGTAMKFDVYGNWATNFGDNNNDGIANASGDNISFSQASGNYLIQFNDQTNAYSFSPIAAAPTAPQANAGNNISIDTGSVASFNATGSTDLNGDISSYTWTSTAFSQDLTGAQPDFQFDTAGSYVVTLTVVDATGLSDQDTITVTVEDPIVIQQQDVSVTFTCNNGTTSLGQSVYVVGNVAELGNWNSDNAIILDADNYPIWEATLTMPATTNIEWKCIKVNGTQVSWQGGGNNTVTTGAAGSSTTTSGSF